MRSGRIRAFDFLMKYNADASVRNSRGHTAGYIALAISKCESTEVIIGEIIPNTNWKQLVGEK